MRAGPPGDDVPVAGLPLAEFFPKKAAASHEIAAEPRRAAGYDGGGGDEVIPGPRFLRSMRLRDARRLISAVTLVACSLIAAAVAVLGYLLYRWVRP